MTYIKLSSRQTYIVFPKVCPSKHIIKEILLLQLRFGHHTHGYKTGVPLSRATHLLVYKCCSERVVFCSKTVPKIKIRLILNPSYKTDLDVPDLPGSENFRLLTDATVWSFTRKSNMSALFHGNMSDYSFILLSGSCRHCLFRIGRNILDYYGISPPISNLNR